MSRRILAYSTIRNRKMNAAVQLLAVRFSSHDNKPSLPVNEPPNDRFPFKIATIDDLPVPEGNYYEDFKKQNRRFWRDFILGVSWLTFSIYGLIASDVVVWNAYPPPMPPKEERIKSFWVQPTYWDDEEDE